jgi:hypothetical protein
LLPGGVSFAFHGRTPASMPRTAQQARLASLTYRRDPDDPELIEARRDFWANEIAEHIRKVVDQAPPLTDAQIGRITTILAQRRGGG